MTWDLAVVGAGPAGATLAGLAARAGARVLLLDAARFPRPKPCGECLNPGAVAALHRLGLWPAVAPLAPVALAGWHLQAGSRCCRLDFPPGQRARAVDRARLDQALLGWAAAGGAEVVEGVRVVDVLRDGGRVVGVVAGAARGAGGGRRPYPARLVAGADGLRSTVARRLGLAGTGPGPARVAVAGHWEGVAGLGDRGELHFGPGGAVVGLAPVGPATAVVTVVGPAGAAGAAALSRWPGLRERFAAARPVGRALGAGPFDRPVRGLVAPGALLLGDAAGYFDPLTGQGIYRALRSAELAAEACLNGSLPAYSQALSTEFAPAVRLQRWIDAVVRRPALLRAGFALLAAVPPAGRLLLRRVGDCPPGGVPDHDADDE